VAKEGSIVAAQTLEALELKRKIDDLTKEPAVVASLSEIHRKSLLK
jgi:hypothetical protein